LTGREDSTQRKTAGRGGQVFLVLTLMIGALVGMVVAAFILLMERIGAGLYPAGGATWRSVLLSGEAALKSTVRSQFLEAATATAAETAA
jgi:hypothetical protein